MSDARVQVALASIRAAFPQRPLDTADAFSEWGTTYIGASTFEGGARGQAWTELDAAFLERHHDALPYFGPSSICDYLPAYLTALLRGDPVLDGLPEYLLGILTRTDPDRFDERFAQLSRAQRAAVRDALLALEDGWGASPRARVVRAALESYWERAGRSE